MVIRQWYEGTIVRRVGLRQAILPGQDEPMTNTHTDWGMFTDEGDAILTEVLRDIYKMPEVVLQLPEFISSIKAREFLRAVGPEMSIRNWEILNRDHSEWQDTEVGDALAEFFARPLREAMTILAPPNDELA